jgi:hypothetical protein
VQHIPLVEAIRGFSKTRRRAPTPTPG